MLAASQGKARHPRFLRAVTNASVRAGARHLIAVGESIFLFDTAGDTAYNDDGYHGGAGSMGLFAQCGDLLYAVTNAHVLMQRVAAGGAGGASGHAEVLVEPAARHPFIVHSVTKAITPKVDWPSPAGIAEEVLEPAATYKGMRYHRLPVTDPSFDRTDVGVVEVRDEWSITLGCSTVPRIPAAQQYRETTGGEDKLAHLLEWWQPWPSEVDGYSLEVDEAWGAVGDAGAFPTVHPSMWAAGLAKLTVKKTGTRTGYTQGHMLTVGVEP